MGGFLISLLIFLSIFLINFFYHPIDKITSSSHDVRVDNSGNVKINNPVTTEYYYYPRFDESSPNPSNPRDNDNQSNSLLNQIFFPLKLIINLISLPFKLLFFILKGCYELLLALKQLGWGYSIIFFISVILILPVLGLSLQYFFGRIYFFVLFCLGRGSLEDRIEMSEIEEEKQEN